MKPLHFGGGGALGEHSDIDAPTTQFLFLVCFRPLNFENFGKSTNLIGLKKTSKYHIFMVTCPGDSLTQVGGTCAPFALLSTPTSQKHITKAK